MMEHESAIAWLQGFLHAFEWFNHKTDHVATFTLDLLPKPGTAREAVEALFGEDLESLTLDPVEDWPTHVRELLGRWLFQFGDRSSAHLEDPRGAFSLSHESFRATMLDEVMGRLMVALRPTAAWTARVRTRSFYECGYEDLVLEEPDRLVYLHLGWSD